MRFLKRLPSERNAPPPPSCAIRERNMADGRLRFTQFGHNCRDGAANAFSRNQRFW
jgi:hypothetical protein